MKWNENKGNISKYMQFMSCYYVGNVKFSNVLITAIYLEK